MNVMLLTFAELPCEKGTLELQIVFMSHLSGSMQTLLSVKSESISRWSSDDCVELIKEKRPPNRYGRAGILMAKT
jgi:hypothetical protein